MKSGEGDGSVLADARNEVLHRGHLIDRSGLKPQGVSVVDIERPDVLDSFHLVLRDF